MKKRKSEIEVVTETVERTVKEIERGTDRVMRPIQRTLFKRFPITSVLLVAFGVSATTTAGQLLFMRVSYFLDHPIVLLIIGLLVLVILGKLHQKLG